MNFTEEQLIDIHPDSFEDALRQLIEASIANCYTGYGGRDRFPARTRLEAQCDVAGVILKQLVHHENAMLRDLRKLYRRESKIYEDPNIWSRWTTFNEAFARHKALARLGKRLDSFDGEKSRHSVRVPNLVEQFLDTFPTKVIWNY